ncbi:hypothetical protein G4G28_05855 [Massilia sp. Dwa41.01b]|uniref:hypothetical protein n=1 Tax=unclassified Massilia TaxID=2609279 RepID=UPI00160434C5|nr:MULTISPECIES: hypothetical protein [unclassified Massilia]QNA88136.1 hypothetical protein G4G28_05855 [Massilia sp. Dwa41.01b]QNA99042.1 hypothetical protein G4G31_09580 [Massilia sp. Se16.2.3]
MNERISTPRAQQASASPSPSTDEGVVAEKRASGVTWGITILSSMSLILTLLGYGVSLAVETVFGLPHESIYSSVLDLIGLSAYAVISLVLGLGEITWWPLFEQLLLPSLLGALIPFALVCCAVFLKSRRASARTRTKSVWRYLIPPNPRDTTGELLGKGAIASGFFGGLIMISPFLMVGALMITVVVISIVPMFGMQLGSHYLQKFVVAPDFCEPVKSRTMLLQTWSKPRKKDAPAITTATCVAVFNNDAQVASGRLVVSTATAIILFEPNSGLIRRIPIGEVTVVPTDLAHQADPPKPAGDEKKGEEKK